jgi:hypothetical protein
MAFWPSVIGRVLFAPAHPSGRASRPDFYKQRLPHWRNR